MTIEPGTKKYLLLAIVLGVVLVAGIVATILSMRAEVEDGKLKVTASFYPMAYLAEEIGGEHVAVTNLTPAGAEPHDFEPSARDIARIEDADLLLLNGTVEVWGERIVSQLESTNVRVLIAAEGLMTLEGAHDDHGEEEHHEEDGHTEEEHEGLDPHVWLDPVRYGEQAERVAEALITLDPENEAAYRENLASFMARITALDTEYQTLLSRCVSEDIITTHTAFAYLAARYGLHQEAITGLTPEAEPSASQLAEIAEFARTNEVTHIFFESAASPALAQTIASEVGAQTLVLHPLEGLARGNNKDYFSVMRENLANLKVALRCTE